VSHATLAHRAAPSLLARTQEGSLDELLLNDDGQDNIEAAIDVDNAALRDHLMETWLR